MDVNAGTSDSLAERTPLYLSPAKGQHPDVGDPESHSRAGFKNSGLSAYRSMDRITAFEAENAGSSPAGRT